MIAGDVVEVSIEGIGRFDTHVSPGFAVLTFNRSMRNTIREEVEQFAAEFFYVRLCDR
jgi:hypothetical protein